MKMSPKAGLRVRWRAHLLISFSKIIAALRSCHARQESTAPVTGRCQQWPHMAPQVAIQGNLPFAKQQLHTLSCNALQTSVACVYLNKNYDPCLESIMKSWSFLSALNYLIGPITSVPEPYAITHQVTERTQVMWLLLQPEGDVTHTSLSRSFSSSPAWILGCAFSKSSLIHTIIVSQLIRKFTKKRLMHTINLLL